MKKKNCRKPSPDPHPQRTKRSTQRWRRSTWRDDFPTQEGSPTLSCCLKFIHSTNI